MRNTNRPIKDAVTNCVMHNGWFAFFSLIAIALIITSFFIPPTGIIDGSVLAATGEIFAFAALWTVIKAIDKGIDARVQHNNTSLTIGDLDPKPFREEHIEDEF